MSGYVQHALQQLKHTSPVKPQFQPYSHMPPNYRQRIQYAPQTNRALLLDKQQTKFIQEVMETFHYYARAIDSTMLRALSTIATEQSAPTTTTMKNTKQFLDYAVTKNKTEVTYKASNMVLAVHSNATYLNKTQARSRAGELFSCQVTPHFQLTMALSIIQYK